MPVVFFNTSSEAVATELNLLSDSFGDLIQAGNHVGDAKVIVYTNPKDALENAGQNPEACNILYCEEYGIKTLGFTEQQLHRHGVDSIIQDGDIPQLVSAVANGYSSYPYNRIRNQEQAHGHAGNMVSSVSDTMDTIINELKKFGYTDARYEPGVGIQLEAAQHAYASIEFDDLQTLTNPRLVAGWEIEGGMGLEKYRDGFSEALELVKEKLGLDIPANSVEVGADRSAMENGEARIKEAYTVTPDYRIQLSGLENKYIVGTSQATLEMLRQIRSYVKFDEDALVLGENGTGKELVTRTLVANSARHQTKKNKYFAVDIGAESDSLFLSNLVGSVKGAFTGAENHNGYLKDYNGGTIFFDEVGNISHEKQQMLLRLLHKDPETDLRSAVPVGSTKAFTFDIRFIMATNADLQQGLRNGTIREDFFNRINNMVIQIPALRERREDIPLMAGHFLEKLNKRYPSERKDMDSSAVQLLKEYPWPGNVRELEKTVMRAFMLEESKKISVDSIIKATLANDYKPAQEVKQNHEYLVEQGLIQVRERQEQEIISMPSVGKQQGVKM